MALAGVEGAVGIDAGDLLIVWDLVEKLGQPPLNAVRYGLEFPMTPTVALHPRVKRACFALQDDHVVDELYRNPEPGRSRTMRMPFFYEPNHSQPKRHRMWIAHYLPPISAIQTMNQKSRPVGILNRKNRNTL